MVLRCSLYSVEWNAATESVDQFIARNQSKVLDPATVSWLTVAFDPRSADGKTVLPSPFTALQKQKPVQAAAPTAADYSALDADWRASIKELDSLVAANPPP